MSINVGNNLLWYQRFVERSNKTTNKTPGLVKLCCEPNDDHKNILFEFKSFILRRGSIILRIRGSFILRIRGSFILRIRGSFILRRGILFSFTGFCIPPNGALCCFAKIPTCVVVSFPRGCLLFLLECIDLELERSLAKPSFRLYNVST